MFAFLGRKIRQKNHYVDFYHNDYDILDVTSSLSFINDSTFDKFFVTSYDPMTKIVRYTPEYATRVKKEKKRERKSTDGSS
jgi:hypothetical protein